MVARHVPADVVNFSVEPDITRLVREGLVDEDWKKRYPNNSTPFGSVVSLVVREGNPRASTTGTTWSGPGWRSSPPTRPASDRRSGTCSRRSRALGEFGAVILVSSGFPGISQTLTLLVHSRYIDEFNEFGAYTAVTLLMLSPSSFWC
jgi:hypothetical protein